MSAPKLSPGQHEVLAFMLAFCVEHRRAPGRREICAALGFASTNTASGHMDALVKKGYVDPGPEARPNNAWPCRDLDGTPIRWTLSYTREEPACPTT
ncbi:MAG TPA: hypothetical protein PLU52_07285 [Opitutaceae bacterium]|nr:hypothetical protein [Opitutaceae bacterium]